MNYFFKNMLMHNCYYLHIFNLKYFFAGPSGFLFCIFGGVGIFLNGLMVSDQDIYHLIQLLNYCWCIFKRTDIEL